MWPCFVKRFNLIEVSTMILILGLYAGAITIIVTDVWYLGWFITGGVLIVIIVLIAILILDVKRGIVIHK